MKSKTDVKKIEALLKKNGISLHWESSGDSMILGSKKFNPVVSPTDIMEVPNNEGLILPHSSNEQRKSLQTKNISYIDSKGNLFLSLDKIKILIEASSKSISKKKKIRIQNSFVRSTLLISPNGLAIIEALFRVPEEQLSLPALQFCKINNLFQPKISKIMTGLGVKNLFDLKSKIIDLPIEWWLFSFDSPVTKRKMTSFFDVAQDYYSLDPKIEKLTGVTLLQKVNKQFNDDVTAGPTLIAQRFGVLVGDEISLWVSPAAIIKLKKEYKLIAGTKEGQRKWKLGVPLLSLIKEDLISHASDKAFLNIKTNILRAIWDLSYSESRLREVRSSMLRSFLK